MEKSKVQVIYVDVPLIAVGKQFTGDYGKSPQFVTEVQNLLSANSIAFIPNKVLGVYYDNPEKTLPEELKCFQGLFPENNSVNIPSSLSSFMLQGKYLYTKVNGDPAKILNEGYNSIFGYIQENGIALKSNAGFQVSTFDNNGLTIEIYMEIV